MVVRYVEGDVDGGTRDVGVCVYGLGAGLGAVVVESCGRCRWGQREA